jgi:hypothetical protein
MNLAAKSRDSHLSSAHAVIDRRASEYHQSNRYSDLGDSPGLVFTPFVNGISQQSPDLLAQLVIPPPPTNFRCSSAVPSPLSPISSHNRRKPSQSTVVRARFWRSNPGANGVDPRSPTQAQLRPPRIMQLLVLGSAWSCEQRCTTDNKHSNMLHVCHKARKQHHVSYTMKFAAHVYGAHINFQLLSLFRSQGNRLCAAQQNGSYSTSPRSSGVSLLYQH